MEVVVHKNVSGAVDMVSDLDQNGDSLTKAICPDKKTSRLSDLVLTNCKQNVLLGNKKLDAFGIKNNKNMECLSVHRGMFVFSSPFAFLKSSLCILREYYKPPYVSAHRCVLFYCI